MVLVNGHVAPCFLFFPIYTLWKKRKKTLYIYLQYFSTKLGCHVNGFVLFFVIVVVINQNDMPTWIHHLECFRTLNCLKLWLCCHSFVYTCFFLTISEPSPSLQKKSVQNKQIYVIMCITPLRSFRLEVFGTHRILISWDGLLLFCVQTLIIIF